MTPGLTVGTLAVAAGVKPGTIRYYERLGLLPGAVRTPSGYRVFPAEAIRRLAVVRSAQELRFSLRDLSDFLKARDAGGNPCQRVRDAGERLLTDLDLEIAKLRGEASANPADAEPVEPDPLDDGRRPTRLSPGDAGPQQEASNQPAPAARS